MSLARRSSRVRNRGVEPRVPRQGNRWSQQEDQQYAQQQSPQAPPPAPAAAPDTVTQLKELADLKSQGILTEAEFAAQKAKILGS